LKSIWFDLSKAEGYCFPIDANMKTQIERAVKIIAGLFLGLIGGIVIAFPVFFVCWIILGIVNNDGDIGQKQANKIATWCIPLGALIGFLIPLMEAIKASKEECEDKRKKELDLNDKERAEVMGLLHMRDEMQGLHDSLAPLLDAAALQCSKAEVELNDRSAGLFWDEVEGAVNYLARYRTCIDLLAEKIGYYKAKTKWRPNLPGITPLPVPDGRAIVEELTSLVRQARRNPLWEQNYQTRITNSILREIAGGIDGLASTITNSISTMADRFDTTMRSISFEHSSEIVNQLRRQVTLSRDDSRERRNFEQVVLRKAEYAIEYVE